MANDDVSKYNWVMYNHNPGIASGAGIGPSSMSILDELTFRDAQGNDRSRSHCEARAEAKNEGVGLFRDLIERAISTSDQRNSQLFWYAGREFSTFEI